MRNGSNSRRGNWSGGERIDSLKVAETVLATAEDPKLHEKICPQCQPGSQVGCYTPKLYLIARRLYGDEMVDDWERGERSQGGGPKEGRRGGGAALRGGEVEAADGNGADVRGGGDEGAGVSGGEGEGGGGRTKEGPMTRLRSKADTAGQANDQIPRTNDPRSLPSLNNL